MGAEIRWGDEMGIRSDDQIGRTNSPALNPDEYLIKISSSTPESDDLPIKLNLLKIYDLAAPFYFAIKAFSIFSSRAIISAFSFSALSARTLS